MARRSSKPKSEFTGLTAAWKKTKARERPDFTDLPVGSYQFEITNAEVKETKAGNSLRLWATCVVVGGDYEGRTTTKSWTLASIELKPAGRGSKTKVKSYEWDEMGLEYLMTDMITLGIAEDEKDARTFDPATEVAEAMVGLVFDGAIVESKKVDRDGKPYRNIYVNGLVTEEHRL